MLRPLKASSSHASSRRTIFRALLLLALSTVAHWLGYVLIVNAYLNIGNGPLVSIDVAEIRVGSACTWWPGRVRGRDLQILVHDSKVEMDLRLDEFDASVSMISLLSKVLHTTKTDVHGVSLRIRETRLLPELCKQSPGLPPITRQADPPGIGEGECSAQSETAMAPGKPPLPKDLLRVSLENLSLADIREVWIEDYRLEGKGSLQGRWWFWPTQNMGMALQDFQMHEASIVRNEAKLVQNLDLMLAGALKQVQFADLDAKTLWSAITANASIRLEALELEAIRALVLNTDPIAPPKFPYIDGLANVFSEIHLDAGHVKTLSLDAQAGEAVIELLKQRVLGSMRLKLSLEGDRNNSGRLLFSEGSLTINNVQLRDERHETREFGDTKITVAAQGTSHLDPRAQTAELEFFANVSRSKFIIALIPGGLPHTITDLLVSDSAPASAKGKLYATSDQARVQDLQAEADGLKLTGSFVFSPELKGTLTASYATVSVDIPL